MFHNVKFCSVEQDWRKGTPNRGTRQHPVVRIEGSDRLRYNSYLKEGFGRNYLSAAVRRPYLDEGLSDFIADQWDREFLARRGRWIRDLKVRRGVPPPKFEELQKYASFYDLGDRELHYWISALLIQRMIVPRRAQ